VHVDNLDANPSAFAQSMGGCRFADMQASRQVMFYLTACDLLRPLRSLTGQPTVYPIRGREVLDLARSISIWRMFLSVRWR
jgi:hypothetical protein